jgi:hypothetical protein
VYIQEISPGRTNQNQRFTCQRCGAVMKRGEHYGKTYQVWVTHLPYGDPRIRSYSEMVGIVVCTTCAEPFQAYRQLSHRVRELRRLLNDADRVLEGEPFELRTVVLDVLQDRVSAAEAAFRAERDRCTAFVPTWSPELVAKLEKAVADHPGWS